MVHLLGIRHHGPGSARNVKAFLEELKPDIVLIEGPPEANALLQWANHAELKPPVSILVYQPENPQQALFYPFAEFSPEWQAIQYARKNNKPVRFMDLPAVHHFGIEKEKADKQNQEQTVLPETLIAETSAEIILKKEEAEEESTNEKKYIDPISYLAHAAGFDDGETWWEHQFEYRQDNLEVFESVKEAMQVLRETYPDQHDAQREELREAYMRKVIREAEKELYQSIAVICGAWHVPALTDLQNAKQDNELLKGLPKAKAECTWTPWTYSRLSYFSGYGAGIASPGWYHHLWKYPGDGGIRWMIKVAKLLRKQRIDVSVANVIEAVRLAETLAILRGLSRPGLEEMNEAVLTVLCNGESIMLELIHKELIVSNRIGNVPVDIPKPPLQLDIEKYQKKLRLQATAEVKEYMLDLRKETDLGRSIFLHRMELLEIRWGTKQQVSGKGTFKEQWQLQWDPAFSIDIIEKGSLGNTVEEAATRFIIDRTGKTNSLREISGLLENTIPAELPVAVNLLIQHTNNLAATTGDVIQLMEVIPGLVSVSRYGNVRKTDADLVFGIVSSLITRICISLPPACTSVNEDAAAHLLELFFNLNDAVSILNDEDISSEWHNTLTDIAFNRSSSPVIAGYSTRLLYDFKIVSGEKLMKAFSFSMSAATPPSVAAAWLEGFLKGSGTVLLIDTHLWDIIDSWVETLDADSFTHVLPLLRRTFSGFSRPERRKLGEKVKAGKSTYSGISIPSQEEAFDHERAKLGLPVVFQLLGMNKN
jgi:hypothetical protein